MRSSAMEARPVSPPKMLLVRTGLSAISVSLLFCMETRLLVLGMIRLALGRRVMSLLRSDDWVMDGSGVNSSPREVGFSMARMYNSDKLRKAARSIKRCASAH
jgi:hypothetical protein